MFTYNKNISNKYDNDANFKEEEGLEIERKK
jgi:hypothetical protein